MQNIAQNIFQFIWPWLSGHGLRIVIIIIGAFIVRQIVGSLVDKFIRRIIKPDQFSDSENEKRREDTLIKVVDDILGVFIWATAGLMLLSEIGLNIGPLLACAGIVGIAIGFGGQYLISDFLGGLSVILENQYRVGDIICINGTCGKVEDVSLRITTLRDLDGTVHYISNGNIKQVSNRTRQFARVNLNIGVAYNSDLEKVISVVNRVGQEMADDPAWKEHIIKAPYFLRVEDFADSAIVIKILGETKPMKQLDVTGELRKRLKIAFDKEGIEIPFPQRVIHQAKG
jgi:small conductance mechanosensitive channel